MWGVGVGGVGKSLLSLNATRQLVDSGDKGLFPDGIWFVPLAGVASTSAAEEQVASMIATLFDVSFSFDETGLDQLISALQRKQTLLLLD